MVQREERRHAVDIAIVPALGENVTYNAKAAMGVPWTLPEVCDSDTSVRPDTSITIFSSKLSLSPLLSWSLRTGQAQFPPGVTTDVSAGELGRKISAWREHYSGSGKLIRRRHDCWMT